MSSEVKDGWAVVSGQILSRFVLTFTFMGEVDLWLISEYCLMSMFVCSLGEGIPIERAKSAS